MSVKHLKEYYQKVCDQYNEMVNDLQELEEYAKTNMVEPERLEQYKQTIAPIKENYLTLSYIMFLLNQPNRKEKQEKYNKQYKDRLAQIPKENTKEGRLDIGDKALYDLKTVNLSEQN